MPQVLGEEEHVPLRYFYHWGTPAVHVSPVPFGAALTCLDDGVRGKDMGQWGCRSAQLSERTVLILLAKCGVYLVGVTQVLSWAVSRHIWC